MSENIIATVKKQKSYSKWILTQKIFRTAICVILCILSLFPFWALLVNATRDSISIQNSFSLIPSTHFVENLNNLMERAAGLGSPFWKCILNSSLIAIPATLFCVYFSSMTAYGVSVYKFKGRAFAWSFILAVMMVPTQVSAIGFFKFMIQLNLNDSYIPLILPAVAAPTTVFFMKQYMKASLSLEIVDAARIDGSGEFHTFNTIVIPLLKPAIATQAIFSFIASWNNLYMPSIILNSQTKNTLPMFVKQLRSEQFRTDFGMVYIGLLLTIVPILIVYFILSKYIIAGVALGGVKE